MIRGTRSRSPFTFPVAAAVAALVATAAHAQLVDLTQSPNTENAGIAKSLGEQNAAGVGNVTTPNSSIFIIKRDPARAIRRGRQLFQRKFAEWQGLGPRTGDGTGNIEADGSIGANPAVAITTRPTSNPVACGVSL